MFAPQLVDIRDKLKVRSLDLASNTDMGNWAVADPCALYWTALNELIKKFKTAGSS